MKIAVCLKQVPARDAPLQPSLSSLWIREDDLTFELNEPDAYALEEALRLKERHGGEVVAISAGPSRAVSVLREALARGADRAIHVDADCAAADGASVARVLSHALAVESCDLVLTGLQSDDQGAGQTGVMMAEYMKAAHVTIVMEVQATAGGVRVKRELEGGWFQWVSVPLPAVLTIQSGLNSLRYATLKGIMAAKKKELRVVSPAPGEFGPSRMTRLAMPERQRRSEMLQGSPAAAAEALVQRLRHEARVLP